MDLNNKVFVLIGSNGGIGSEVVKRLNGEHANLILVDKDAVESFACDLTNRQDTISLCKKINKFVNKVDCLINCSGIGIYKPINDLSLEEWDYSLALNLTAPFILIKELKKLMEGSEMSLIMNIGSGAGVIPMKNRSAYCSSKFGLRGLTLSLNEEYKGLKPHFCLITLGSTLTGFAGVSVEKKTDLNKQGQAYFTKEWVADKLIEILKDDNREVEYTLYPSDYGFGTWKNA